MNRVILSLCLLLVACDRPAVTACPADLSATLAPSDTTIAIGGHADLRFTILGCSGASVLTDTFSWQSADATIAVVDQTSGRVTGLSVGMVNIAVMAQRYGITKVARIKVQ